MKDQLTLMEAQLQEAASRMSEVFRAAMLGKSLTGYDVCLSGVAPEELCHPLTQEQLAAIRSCFRFIRQEVVAVCCRTCGTSRRACVPSASGTRWMAATQTATPCPWRRRALSACFAGV
ncbi:MAG: hypothetical protein IJ343_06365 [Clostridia bacterium]|nr:hypothetical protein [Clostridia bacterium]